MSNVRPTFRQCAVISGLVTQAQLDAANNAASGGQPVQVNDEQLAKRLIQDGLMNAWQVAQLKLGRTKFTLGPYHVVDSIGQGGMGQVFKAEHRIMGRTVAIKVLPRHRSTPDAIASFSHEIRAQAQLDHENLVRAFDAGHDGNVHFLVTEYVPGTDLRKFVRSRGKLTQQEAATIISQTAAGLAHAHARGLIHRDIKPGNLLVTPTGMTKLSDLGLAAFLDPAEIDPRAGKIVGTVDYVSPEHVLNPAGISPASDIYSLGCTLYYAVTGKVPFPGGNPRDKAKRHCEDTPINPRVFNPTLTDEFLHVLEMMMEKDPARRIGSAAEVAARLSPWAGEAVVPIGPGEENASRGNGVPESHTPTLLENDIRRDTPARPLPIGAPLSWSPRNGAGWQNRTTEELPEIDHPYWVAALVVGPLFVAAGFLLATLFVLAKA